ncbi:MAG: hypothetical protein F6K36_31110 [Symploca sp. SIO3C6]|nr:hypothetical protein [Symploca sp. SIO3C6]
MGWIFWSGEAKTGARCRSIGRGFQRGQTGKDAQAEQLNILTLHHHNQSLELDSFRSGGVAHGLAVFTPQRRTRLASAKTLSAQTIRFSLETL